VDKPLQEIVNELKKRNIRPSILKIHGQDKSSPY